LRTTVPRFKRLAWALAICLAVARPAHAEPPPAGENVTYAYAQVLRATPVHATVRVRVPEQRCARDGGDATGGTVAGAVIGGALGHQAGKGDGRKVATVAGAVIGGAIGRRVDRNNGSAGTRCRTVEVERDERRIIGYDVEYQYKGDTYMSRVDYDPGSRLRIRVSVTPDESATYVH
jgi:uncharacterized protein YcfJ